MIYYPKLFYILLIIAYQRYSRKQLKKCLAQDSETKITIVIGVFGSGKSSIVFDAIAAEAQYL